MRIWFDTEFIEDGKTIDLLSIGMVREDGETLYLESADCDKTKASTWVAENVLPHLDGRVVGRSAIADEVRIFAGSDPKFWAYYADYDWVVLCQLYGTMMDLPKGWPMYCRDLKQLVGKTPLLGQPETAHNALSDAVWTMEAHKHFEQTR